MLTLYDRLGINIISAFFIYFLDSTWKVLKSGHKEIQFFPLSALEHSMSWLNNIKRYFIVTFDSHARAEPIAGELTPPYTFTC